MKTLIIHPQDVTTDFLSVAYKTMINKTIVKTNKSINDIRGLIDSHCRFMMMGHGSPSGLFSIGQFGEPSGLIIDHSMADLLRFKNNNLFIWCNADRFVNEFNLKGFYTGMFISEIEEAWYCGLHNITQDMIDESNLVFCELLSKVIQDKTEVIHHYILKQYGLLAKKNPVASYNHKRLYTR